MFILLAVSFINLNFVIKVVIINENFVDKGPYLINY